MLLSPSSLSSPHNRPMNPREEGLKQGRDFNQGASSQRKWQASESPSNGVWMPDSFIDQRGGEVRKQSKKAINLANISLNGKPQAGDVFISSFLLYTGGQGSEQRHFNSQAEGQDSLIQTILYDYNNKSNRKPVKETVPT